jgi:hypothetical protein
VNKTSAPQQPATLDNPVRLDPTKPSLSLPLLGHSLGAEAPAIDVMAEWLSVDPEEIKGLPKSYIRRTFYLSAFDAIQPLKRGHALHRLGAL